METNPFRLPRGQRPTSPPPPGVDGGRPRHTTHARGWVGRARRGVEECVRGQRWWIRLPLLLVLAWFLRGYLVEPGYRTLFSGITLGFHEMGHAVFLWFRIELLTAAGGTVAQLAVPLGAAAYLLVKQRDPFGATVGTFWLGTSLVGAGRYAADARARELPLVSPFGPVDASSHDWAFMLGEVGLLRWDRVMGGAMQHAGVLVMAASVAAGVWVLWLMARSEPREEPATRWIQGPGEEPRGRGTSEEERLRAFLARHGEASGLPRGDLPPSARPSRDGAAD